MSLSTSCPFLKQNEHSATSSEPPSRSLMLLISYWFLVHVLVLRYDVGADGDAFIADVRVFFACDEHIFLMKFLKTKRAFDAFIRALCDTFIADVNVIFTSNEAPDFLTVFRTERARCHTVSVAMSLTHVTNFPLNRDFRFCAFSMRTQILAHFVQMCFPLSLDMRMSSLWNSPKQKEHSIRSSEHIVTHALQIYTSSWPAISIPTSCSSLKQKEQWITTSELLSRSFMLGIFFSSTGHFHVLHCQRIARSPHSRRFVVLRL